ncbi:hypothetical protein [uncultured Aquimarina sp.]|uniref:hypothetical protein n=1 Tax=uncultured Aquimarina sp. TaxID=575652 RepID=UPI002638CF3E|nr:hypothetical protein [uncultured Aquimarina sp.]
MLDFLNEANWWCLLLLLLIAFLLGWFLSKWSLKNKYKTELDQCLREKEKLRNGNFKKANTTFTNPIPVETNDTQKTIASGDTETKPQLNFESFGKADESQKDDLKLISGVGPFIEEKLNSIGIYTFDQISRFTKEDIDTVTDLIQFFPGRIERDNWANQAEKLKDK